MPTYLQLKLYKIILAYVYRLKLCQRSQKKVGFVNIVAVYVKLVSSYRSILTKYTTILFVIIVVVNSLLNEAAIDMN